MFKNQFARRLFFLKPTIESNKSDLSGFLFVENGETTSDDEVATSVTVRCECIINDYPEDN